MIDHDMIINDDDIDADVTIGQHIESLESSGLQLQEDFEVF